MCYTKDNNEDEKVVEKETNAKKINDEDYLKASFNSGFSHPKMLIQMQENPNELVVANWGLVPSFIKDNLKAKEYFLNTLNAKSETIFEKVSFKDNIMPHRCIVPIKGFYEWRDINKTKYPYYITTKEQKIMLLGGIYDYWVDRSTGEIHRTYSVVTTEANPLMSKIHNLKKRQPLMLTKELAKNWLNPDLKENDIKELMQPMHEDLMCAHTIKKINPKNIDIYDSHLNDKFEYPELELIDLL